MLRVLYLVRHGETDWNAAGRWQGQTDVGLNATGRTQAIQVADALRGRTIAGVVASDLGRASETARIVADAIGVPLVYLDSALRERSFGCFEGLTRQECEQRHPESWRAWLAERRPPPGGEDQAALALRVTGAVVKAAEHVAGEAAAVVVVSHAAAIRAFVAAATGTLPPPVANAEVRRVTWDGRAFTILGGWSPLPDAARGSGPSRAARTPTG